jgi:hypothetical protein
VKSIEFINTEPSLDDLVIMPKPTQKTLPGWYKDMEGYPGGTYNPENDEDGFPSETIKKCIPILDSLSMGYLIPLWTDTWVSKKIDGISWMWSAVRQPVKAVEGHHPMQVEGFPMPHEHIKEVFKWINPWLIKTPPGYSTLFIHPLNRNDLPFTILPAVVDTDTFPLSVNFPFFLKNNFSGLIPYGTPIAQAIPFKRDSFKSTRKEINVEKYMKVHNRHESTFINRYKNLWWSKKDFQ